ncbi:MAG: hypothetical protein JO279_12165 [Verrucomicrobia bacterium]|nr:hypothetical protein [Verrucomicrobiota bacterium]MBV8377746.1 hypothetical protein [Verrucomicrobiota bacterium]
MKIVDFGGSGLIGTKLVSNLRKLGRELGFSAIGWRSLQNVTLRRQKVLNMG